MSALPRCEAHEENGEAPPRVHGIGVYLIDSTFVDIVSVMQVETSIVVHMGDAETHGRRTHGRRNGKTTAAAATAR